MSIEIIASIVIMVLLFLRQISILKEQNKISYAPVIVAVGTSFALLHFIINAQGEEFVLVLKESLGAVLISIILYVVTNIFQQASRHENSFVTRTESMSDQQMLQLQDRLASLERLLLETLSHKKDAPEDRAQAEARVLGVLSGNQHKILRNFAELEKWHSEITTLFEDFSSRDLPALDEVLKSHLQDLRADHQKSSESVLALLESIQKDGSLSAGEFDLLKKSVAEFNANSKEMATNITNALLSQSKEVVGSMLNVLKRVDSHAQHIDTLLYESESRLANIKNNSEVVMRQLVLSAKKLEEVQGVSIKLESASSQISDLASEIEKIKEDYARSKLSLDGVVGDFERQSVAHFGAVKNELSFMVQDVNSRIDELLQRLDGIKQHSEASENLQLLARQTKLKSSYLDI